MTPEIFWREIGKYLKIEELKLGQLEQLLDIRQGSLTTAIRKKTYPSPKHLVRLKGVISDDTLYQTGIATIRSVNGGKTGRLMDDLLLSLKVSREVIEQERLKRKIQRIKN